MQRRLQLPVGGPLVRLGNRRRISASPRRGVIVSVAGGADICSHFDRTLLTPGAPEVLRRLCGRYEGGVSFFCCHGNGRLDVRQAASRSSSQYRRGRSLLIRELTNGRKVHSLIDKVYKRKNRGLPIG